jgi:3-oxoadipate enol-lactonase
MDPQTDHPWNPEPGSDAHYAHFAKERRVVVDDGTTIAYTLRGAEGRGVPILFANGWSSSDAYWGELLPALQERGHPCVLPDTRGHGGSGLPRAPGRGARNLTLADVAMSRLAGDLLAVVDDAGYREVLVVAHSMGVQVALELYRLAADRVAGQVLIAGTAENPAKTFYGRSIGDRLFPLVAGTMRWAPEIVKPVQATIGPRVGHLGARLARAASSKTTPEALQPYLLHLKGVDVAVMALMAGAMRAHSATDLLPSITAPTLVVAAGADVFTPARCSEAMHHRIPASELVTFPDGAHTLPVEEPAALARTIEDFVARRLAPRPARRRRRREPKASGPA